MTVCCDTGQLNCNSTVDTSSYFAPVALLNTLTTAVMTTTTASTPSSARLQPYTGSTLPVRTSFSSVRRVLPVEEEAQREEAAVIDAIQNDQKY